jgi:hypothetical protein
MAFDGNGTFNQATTPVVSGTVISATNYNTQNTDFANGLSTTLTKDGQTNPTANLKMAGYRHTGVGNAVARTDYAATGQVQDNSFTWCGTAGGTANALTLTPSPAITAYAAGQEFQFRSGAGANTGATTVAVSGLTAQALQLNGAALIAGDIAATRQYTIRYDGTNFQLVGVGGAVADGSLTAAKESDDAWSSLASATTTDLGAQTSRNVLITGTTTITSFGNTGNEGRIRNVRFSGILTLTHNATSLILPTAANITTAVGDTAVFVKDSTASANWRCIDYQRASGQALAVASTQVIVDRAYAVYPTNANLSAAIPFDDTIPQSTEGVQILSASITPKSTTNRIRVRFQGEISSAGAARFAAALFSTVGGANALATDLTTVPTASGAGKFALEFEHVPGTTAAQTYTIRTGDGSTTTHRFNGSDTARLFGGTMGATLVLEEITA